jgi:hypothetical protein
MTYDPLRWRECPVCHEQTCVDYDYCCNCGYPMEELRRRVDYESSPEGLREMDRRWEEFERQIEAEQREEGRKKYQEGVWKRILEERAKAERPRKPESKLVNAIVYLLCFAGYAFVAFAIYHGCTGP